jgi:hypothetical protein
MRKVTLGSIPAVFYGWRIVAAVFVLAAFGWGLGFYGPPIYLHFVREARGWSLPLVSTAMTAHFLIGAIVVANLPRLYQRYGVPAVTKVGSIALAAGVTGWAVAREPWQLFAATVLSGGGWVTMGAAAVNAIIAPWFVRTRPAALASAYNGSSVGGAVFSPLWVAAIGLVGFPLAAAITGIAMVAAIWLLADIYYSKTPEQMGLSADGDAGRKLKTGTASSAAPCLPGTTFWTDFRFLTLAAGMALGLFAQIGLLEHLFSLLAPALGVQLAAFAAGSATVAAIVGRTVVGWLMLAGANQRLFACGSYVVQIVGSLACLFAGDNAFLLLFGVVLFGVGIGNATSLPPLIAQAEFAQGEVARVVALIVAISQATYAFAPAAFGLIRQLAPAGENSSGEAASWMFVTAALIQASAVATLLLGWRLGTGPSPAATASTSTPN